MDIRTPVTLTDDECDLIAEIVREAIDEAIAASSQQPGSSPDLKPSA
jgi:hypothetical protein